NLITAAMFLTAMAGNPLAQSLAKHQGVTISWMSWFLAALVPGILSLVLVPLIIYKLYPPEIKETPNAKSWAQNELDEMGIMSKSEKFMIGIFL
ncbi:anion permease, partial [Staphylococcus capitis]